MRLKGYRTLVMGTLIAVIGGINALNPVVGDETGGVLLAVSGILTVILRLVTDGPVGFKKGGE